MRQSCGTFKNAAGIFYEDRYIPVVESILNIVFSLLFVQYFGLAGVFMGTIVSALALYSYSYPKYVYGMVFKRGYKQYLKDYIKFALITLIASIPTYLISERIHMNTVFLQLIVNAILCLIIPNFVYYVFFRRTEEYKYCKHMLLNTLRLHKVS